MFLGAAALASFHIRVSRFGGNIRDVLSTGRELSQCGKGLYFVKENICTLSDALVEQASDNVEIGTLKGFSITFTMKLSENIKKAEKGR